MRDGLDALLGLGERLTANPIDRTPFAPEVEALLRVFDQTGNRDNKLRARMKWVVDQLGIDEVRRRVLKLRHTLPASSS